MIVTERRLDLSDIEGGGEAPWWEVSFSRLHTFMFAMLVATVGRGGGGWT